MISPRLTLGHNHVWRCGIAALSVVLLLLGGHTLYARPASSPVLPIPESLQSPMQFWIRIFTEIDEPGGLLHDPHDLTIVYHTLRHVPGDPHKRQRTIDRYRRTYATILTTLARGKRQGLTRAEKRVLALFQGQRTAATFRAAAKRMRFQTGMRRRFAAGLRRARTYLPDIERAFAAEGLPRFLTLLPHVESSFSNTAYSKHGAAGLWQIMPATGRQFLTINAHVDERLDVRQASRAAAKILKANYQMLGTWPLAITAYNHGAYGMKRAVDALGTTDFGVIVQQYRSPTFGFASRNFYAEFLAALHVVRHEERYFGHRRRTLTPPTRQRPATAPLATAPPPLQPYRVAKGDTLTAIAQRFQTSVDALVRLNHLAQRHHVQTGQRLVVPAPLSQGGLSRHAGKLPAETTAPSASRPRQAQTSSRPQETKSQIVRRQYYRVQHGDTLTAIASRVRSTVQTLAAFNKLHPPYHLQPGQRLTLTHTVTHHYQVRPGDTLQSIAARWSTTPSTLVELNKLASPNVIHPGQVLSIPPAEMPAPPSQG